MVQRIEHKFDDNGVEMKYCGHKNHKAYVPLSEFGKAKTWDNLRPTCKKCIKSDNDNADTDEKAARKKRSRDYYHEHKIGATQNNESNILSTTNNLNHQARVQNQLCTLATTTLQSTSNMETTLETITQNDAITNTENTPNIAEDVPQEKSQKKERKEHRFQNGVELKHCTSCEFKGSEAWRTLDCFNKEDRRWDKLANWCKDCFNQKRNATRPSRAKPKQTSTDVPIVNSSTESQTIVSNGSVLRKEHKMIEGVEYKWCSSCPSWKDLGQFTKNSTKWDQLESYCKVCKNSKTNAMRANATTTNESNSN